MLCGSASSGERSSHAFTSMSTRVNDCRCTEGTDDEVNRDVLKKSFYCSYADAVWIVVWIQFLPRNLFFETRRRSKASCVSV